MNTPTRRSCIVALLTLLALGSSLVNAAPLGTAFTYQGRLTDGGPPANGSYDLRFTLHEDAAGSFTVAGPMTNTVAVSNGLFTTTLDFGSGVFAGSARWLEIAVRSNGSGAFTPLSLRQPLTPTPYALYSPSAGTAATADGVAPGAVTGPGIATGQVVRSLNGLQDSVRLLPGTNVSVQEAGDAITISATPGTVVTNAGWGLSGNAGTTVNNFLGTTDGQAFQLRVNNARALRLEPGATSPNLIGGPATNNVLPGVQGATIAGGGNAILPQRVTANYGTVGGGGGNSVGGVGGVIAGGAGNSILTNAAYGTIGGGSLNSVQASATNAAIGGGDQNSIGNTAVYATIAGGRQNTINPGANYAAIGGGGVNRIEADAVTSTIGGGGYNQIAAATRYAVIGGGLFNSAGGESSVVGGGLVNTNAGLRSVVAGGSTNHISSTGNDSFIGGGWSNTVSGTFSTISGGARNTITSDALYATIGGGLNNSVVGHCAAVPGGLQNFADGHASFAMGYQSSAGGSYSSALGYQTVASGAWSFAAGNRAKALHMGTFVWADSTSADFASTANNQFLIRAKNVGINTEAPIGGLHVVTSFDQAPLHLQNPYGATQVTFQKGDGYEAALVFYGPAGDGMLQFQLGGNTLRLNPSMAATDGDFFCNSLHEVSDRSRKTDIEAVNPAEVLERVVSLPISTWAFTNSVNARHLGPMAQDFHAAFGLGQDDKTIGPRDVASVALAAIQGLNQKLETKNAALEKEVAELKALAKSLVEKVNGGGQ